MKTDSLLKILEEQITVSFTGKVNVLQAENNQFLGAISLHEGELIFVSYKSVLGIKGFYNLVVEEFDGKDFSFIVEPELIDVTKKNIQYPYSVIKNKLNDIIKKYQDAKEQKPPENLKLIIEPSFIANSTNISSEEFSLLCTMSDYNRVYEIYNNCDLLDYEITNALVSLRKKHAIKVIKTIGKD